MIYDLRVFLLNELRNRAFRNCVTYP